MEQTNRYLQIDSKFKYLIFLVIRIILLPICRLLYGSKRLWLICERGDDAQDNGFVFFKYLIENRKDINPVFLIKKTSPDYIKVKNVGKVVPFGSIKHFLMCVGTRVKISSNLYGYAPWIVMEKFFRRNKTKDIHVFLQHGISKNYHESFLASNNKGLSFFITGAAPEYEYFKEVCGYEDGVVVYTGLPRFDLLFNAKIKDQILIMPTWRTYLKGLSTEEFKKSEFFTEWNSLLTNSVFLKLCSRSNLSVKFYLHHELQLYSSCFENIPNIVLVHYSDQTVQGLLKESKVLITDFSSVYFDFAFLKKPIIFFQFDEKDYFSKHYEKGYFDYRKSNFGAVCTSVDLVLKELEKIEKNNYLLSKLTEDSIDNYFKFRDSNNSKRIFEIIKNRLKI